MKEEKKEGRREEKGTKGKKGEGTMIKEERKIL